MLMGCWRCSLRQGVRAGGPSWRWRVSDEGTDEQDEGTARNDKAVRRSRNIGRDGGEGDAKGGSLRPPETQG